MKGYFGIGVFHIKIEQNLGTLWRSAYSLDASLLATIGRRYSRQGSDTVKATNHLPLQHYSTFDEFMAALPFGCQLIGVELDPRAVPLHRFAHPERAFYLLGAEDHGLPPSVREVCHQLIKLPGRVCLNVAVAGSLVMADRIMKMGHEPILEAGACERVRKQLDGVVDGMVIGSNLAEPVEWS